MNYELCIKANEVFADIKSAAWLESELHPDLNRHRRHQMADICEEDNDERVWRVLGVCEAEIRLALIKLLYPKACTAPADDLERPKFWKFKFLFQLSKSSVSFMKVKIHEYFVAAVMADRTAVIIPEAASVWTERAETALRELRQAAAATMPPYSRASRPLWPL